MITILKEKASIQRIAKENREIKGIAMANQIREWKTEQECKNQVKK